MYNVRLCTFCTTLVQHFEELKRYVDRFAVNVARNIVEERDITILEDFIVDIDMERLEQTN